MMANDSEVTRLARTAKCVIVFVLAIFGVILLTYLAMRFLIGPSLSTSGLPEPDWESQRTASESEAADRTPRWHRDSQAIVVNVGDRIIRMGMAADKLEEIGRRAGDRAHYSPSVSLDGRVVYQGSYYNNRERRLERHVEVSATDGLARSLAESTLNSSWGPIYPVWSPNGERLAFVTVSPGGSRSQRHVISMAADGSDINDFSVGGYGSFGDDHLNRIAWSNNSERIAYLTKHSDRNVRYHTARWDGSEDTRWDGTATSTPVFNSSLPAWSRTDDRLYFAKWKQIGSQRQYALYSIDVDGTDERLLADLGDINVDEVKLSPDGSVLLLGGSHLVNVDGTGLKSFQEDYGLPTGYASWSPDGSRIAVYSQIGALALYTMAPDGPDARALLRRSADGSLEPGRGQSIPNTRR